MAKTPPGANVGGAWALCQSRRCAAKPVAARVTPQHPDSALAARLGVVRGPLRAEIRMPRRELDDRGLARLGERRRRRPADGRSLEQERGGLEPLRAVVDGELAALARFRLAPERDPGVGAILPEHVVGHRDVAEPVLVIAVVARD